MSGIGTYLKNIMPGLISSDRFSVTCLGYKELEYFDWFPKVKFIEVTSPILSLAEQMELFLKVPACDIFWSPNWNVPLLPIKAKKKLVTIHDVYHLANAGEFSLLKIALMKIYMRFISKFYSWIITVSSFSKKEIIKYTPISAGKISVIPLAVDDNYELGGEELNTNEEYMLYVGNVKPHKNLRLCLEAFKLIENKNLKFYIVGKKDGFITKDETLKEYIDNLDSRVIFTGHISDEKLKGYYRKAKFFLFPSKYEGFGLPILEAMKFNLPIIASKSASIPEVGGDKVIYFDSSNVLDLVEKINAFLAGEIKCAVKDYSDHLKKFDWQITTFEHIKILNNLL